MGTETQGKPRQIERHRPTDFSEFDETTAKFIVSKILPDWDYKPLEELDYKKVFRLTKPSEQGARLTLQISPELGAVRFTKQLKGTEFDDIDLIFPTHNFTLGHAGLVFEDSVDKRKLIFYSRLYRITSTRKERPPFFEEIRFD